MRLVIEEARDHTECMDNLRAQYGADCVVVHSFKTDDRYRVIIALETPSSLRPMKASDPQVKNVVSQPKGLQPTFWLAEEDHHAALPENAAYRAEQSGHEAEPELAFGTPQNDLIPDEITAELLRLAARVKALESAQIEQRLAPEPQAAQALLFSDVLKDTVNESTQDNNWGPSCSAMPTISERAPNDTPVRPLATTIETLKRQTLRNQATEASVNKHLTRPVSNVSLADEARKFMNASQGAASFAALLTDHVASSRNGTFKRHFEMTAPGH